MFVYIDRLKLPIIYNLFDQWLFKTCGSEREREREREQQMFTDTGQNQREIEYGLCNSCN